VLKPEPKPKPKPKPEPKPGAEAGACPKPVKEKRWEHVQTPTHQIKAEEGRPTKLN
jgi:hypothetical protein